MTVTLIGQQRLQRGRLTVYSRVPSKSYRYTHVMPLRDKWLTFLDAQSYGLAERLLREGNQMHMAVRRCYEIVQLLCY